MHVRVGAVPAELRRSGRSFTGRPRPEGPVTATGATAEQIPVVVAPELVTQEIEGEGVDAGIDEGETEADDLEDVPEHIVLGVVVVEPEEEDVAGQPEDGEHDDEGEDETSDLLASFHLENNSEEYISDYISTCFVQPVSP